MSPPSRDRLQLQRASRCYNRLIGLGYAPVTYPRLGPGLLPRSLSWLFVRSWGARGPPLLAEWAVVRAMEQNTRTSRQTHHPRRRLYLYQGRFRLCYAAGVAAGGCYPPPPPQSEQSNAAGPWAVRRFCKAQHRLQTR
jgi:hypothetical protein